MRYLSFHNGIFANSNQRHRKTIQTDHKPSTAATHHNTTDDTVTYSFANVPTPNNEVRSRKRKVRYEMTSLPLALEKEKVWGPSVSLSVSWVERLVGLYHGDSCVIEDVPAFVGPLCSAAVVAGASASGVRDDGGEFVSGISLVAGRPV
jgi:hypothetical protein